MRPGDSAKQNPTEMHGRSCVRALIDKALLSTLGQHDDTRNT